MINKNSSFSFIALFSYISVSSTAFAGEQKSCENIAFELLPGSYAVNGQTLGSDGEYKEFDTEYQAVAVDDDSLDYKKGDKKFADWTISQDKSVATNYEADGKVLSTVEAALTCELIDEGRTVNLIEQWTADEPTGTQETENNQPLRWQYKQTRMISNEATQGKTEVRPANDHGNYFVTTTYTAQKKPDGSL